MSHFAQLISLCLSSCSCSDVGQKNELEDDVNCGPTYKHHARTRQTRTTDQIQQSRCLSGVVHSMLGASCASKSVHNVSGPEDRNMAKGLRHCAH